MVATALPENTLAAVQQLVTGVAGRLGAGDYDYTTKSGIQKIEKGDIRETPEGRKLFTLNIAIGETETEKPKRSK